MSKIYYKKHGVGYECERVENDECRDLYIILDLPESGTLFINGNIKREVKEGLAIIPERLLADGVYRPKLIKGGELFDLDSFHIGTSVSIPLKSDEYIRSLYSDILALKLRIDTLEERAIILEDKIIGSPII